MEDMALRKTAKLVNSSAGVVQSKIYTIKKYFDNPKLTRKMCYELIDRIIVGRSPKTVGEDRMIDIIYKVDIASVLRHKYKK